MLAWKLQIQNFPFWLENAVEFNHGCMPDMVRITGLLHMHMRKPLRNSVLVWWHTLVCVYYFVSNGTVTLKPLKFYWQIGFVMNISCRMIMSLWSTHMHFWNPVISQCCHIPMLWKGGYICKLIKYGNCCCNSTHWLVLPCRGTQWTSFSSSTESAYLVLLSIISTPVGNDLLTNNCRVASIVLLYRGTGGFVIHLFWFILSL